MDRDARVIPNQAKLNESGTINRLACRNVVSSTRRTKMGAVIAWNANVCLHPFISHPAPLCMFMRSNVNALLINRLDGSELGWCVVCHIRAHVAVMP